MCVEGGGGGGGAEGGLGGGACTFHIICAFRFSWMAISAANNVLVIAQVNTHTLLKAFANNRLLAQVVNEM